MRRSSEGNPGLGPEGYGWPRDEERSASVAENPGHRVNGGGRWSG
jgi:hypothetical protein